MTCDHYSRAGGVSVRPATEPDMPAVRRIYVHYVLHGRSTFEETPPTVAEMVRRRENVLAVGLPYLVAEVEGAVAGYGYAAPYHSRSAYRHTVEDSVYVAEGYQRRGVGAAILAGLVDRCSDGPWRQMVAVIGDSANTGSIALHHRFGFTHVGTLRTVGFKLGQWVDVVLMQRPLGVGGDVPPTDAPNGTEEARA